MEFYYERHFQLPRKILRSLTHLSQNCYDLLSLPIPVSLPALYLPILIWYFFSNTCAIFFASKHFYAIATYSYNRIKCKYCHSVLTQKCAFLQLNQYANTIPYIMSFITAMLLLQCAIASRFPNCNYYGLDCTCS